MSAMSARNLEKSQKYRDEILRRRRNRFFLHLKEATELWLRQTAQDRLS